MWYTEKYQQTKEFLSIRIKWKLVSHLSLQKEKKEWELNKKFWNEFDQIKTQAIIDAYSEMWIYS